MDSAHAHVWAEWRYFPSDAVSRYYETTAGLLTTGTYYSFMVTTGAGTTWDIPISHTSNPSSAVWKFLTNTGNLNALSDKPESELARLGSREAQTAQAMQLAVLL